jgi:hypothetical protein
LPDRINQDRRIKNSTGKSIEDKKMKVKVKCPVQAATCSGKATGSICETLLLPAIMTNELCLIEVELAEGELERIMAETNQNKRCKLCGRFESKGFSCNCRQQYWYKHGHGSTCKCGGHITKHTGSRDPDNPSYEISCDKCGWIFGEE